MIISAAGIRRMGSDNSNNETKIVYDDNNVENGEEPAEPEPCMIRSVSSENSYESVGAGRSFPPAMVLRGSVNSINRMRNQSTFNTESNRRTMHLSYAIMTLALLSASAAQLRFLVAYSKAHSYPVLNFFLISVCIVIEIIVGIGYVILSRFHFTDARAESTQSYLIAGLFIVAIANVIIATFAIDDHVCEVLAKQTNMVDVIDQTPE